MITYFVTLALLVCISPLSLHAQDSRVVKARTLCFQRVADIADIYIQGSKGPRKILMPVEDFSNSFECRLQDGVALFYKQEGENPDGTPKKVVVARTKIGSAQHKVLFYFVPAQQGSKMLYRVMAMDDGLKQFPLGHTRLLNLSKVDVAFQMGEHVRRLKPGKTTHVGEVKKRNRFNMAPVVCKMMDSDGQWRTISESRTRFTKRKRLLVVSYVDPLTHQPLLKVYKDIPLNPPPPLPGA